MIKFEDIEIGDVVKIDTSTYNRYVGLARVTKKAERDGRSIGSLCIGITPLEKCFQKEYWIKPREIIEIKENDKYKNVIFSFIKL